MQMPEDLSTAFLAVEVFLENKIALEDDSHAFLTACDEVGPLNIDANYCDPACYHFHDLVTQQKAILSPRSDLVRVADSFAQHLHDLLGIALCILFTVDDVHLIETAFVGSFCLHG